MSRTRQKQQSEEMRGKILSIARRILSYEGPEALSIRRITKEMDYSAGIVYHYFKGKEEILHALLMEGYGRILRSIRPPEPGLPADQRIRASMIGYINGVLEWPEEYRAIMFSAKPELLAVTSVLCEDVCEKRATFRWLTSTIQDGIDSGVFGPCDPQLTAQALWCAMFGLVSRLIIEGPIPESRKLQLIHRQADIILKGLYP